MTPKRMHVSPEMLVKAAGHTEEVSDALARLASRFETMRSRGEPWGADQYGNQFAEDYKPSATATETNLPAMGEAFRRMSTGQREAAALLRQREEASAENFKRP